MKDAHYTLVKGPSKFDLMMALFDQKGNGGKPHYVTFEADDGQKIAAKIQSVGIEDGSGESWIIEGVVMSTRRPTGRRPILDESDAGHFLSRRQQNKTLPEGKVLFCRWATTGNRTQTAGTTNRSANRYTIVAIFIRLSSWQGQLLSRISGHLYTHF